MNAPGRARPALMCTLSPSGDSAPLVLVPSVGTTPLSLVRLARAIEPRRPVHAFAYAGLEDDGPVHETVEAMAEAYVGELVAFAPRGPYLLGGHCLGGVVALEMARQLEARGRVVARLVLVDSIAPWRADDLRPAAELARLDRELRGDGSPLRRLLESLAARALEHSPMLEPDVRDRLLRMVKVHVEASFAYRARPVRAGTHLLFTEASDPSFFGGWPLLATGGLVRHVIPGDTFSLLKPPHVASVGQRVGEALAGVDA
jgi:thioesterase domain-containing protein